MVFILIYPSSIVENTILVSLLLMTIEKNPI